MSFIDPTAFGVEFLSSAVLISATPGSHLPLLNHSFSVLAQVKRWTQAYMHYSHTSGLEQAKKCNICTVRALERGLCGNEIQVFKLWPREDLNSSWHLGVSLHGYPQTVDWTPHVLSQHAQDSELAAWEDSCFSLLKQQFGSDSDTVITSRFTLSVEWMKITSWNQNYR